MPKDGTTIASMVTQLLRENLQNFVAVKEGCVVPNVLKVFVFALTVFSLRRCTAAEEIKLQFEPSSKKHRTGFCSHFAINVLKHVLVSETWLHWWACLTSVLDGSFLGRGHRARLCGI